MKRILAILDEDEDYSMQLAGYACENGLTPFSVIAFKDPGSLKKFMARQPVDILLNGTDTADEDLKIPGIHQVIHLFEGSRPGYLKNTGGLEKESSPGIYKYQAADRLFREVMELYRGSEGKFSDESFKCGITGVCSPVGRCGKTGFAVTMGRILADDCKVMYLNLEECSGLSALTGTSYKRSLSDIIYSMRQGNLNENVVSASTYKLGRLDYVAPVSCAEDLEEIRADELAELVGYLAVHGHYEALILDAGNLGRNVLPLLECCGIIYAPIIDDAVSQARISEWRGQLLSFGGEDLLGRVRLLRLPVPPETNGTEDYFDSLLYGETGRIIRDLLSDE